MDFIALILIPLLPLSALTGWYCALRSFKKRKSCTGEPVNDYFRGLNYLLQDQPDKAIEVFVRMVEVDSDTVETHLALGSLFRQRGEVDRAIRIHQNIIARPTLSKEQNANAVFELATDFLRAGFFDRSEQLFLQLIGDKSFGRQALDKLVYIAQQGKEWDKAVDYSSRLLKFGGQYIISRLSNYLCEQAEEFEARGELRQARNALIKSLECDPKSIRAEVKLATIALKQGKAKEGVKRLESALNKDSDFISIFLQVLEQFSSVTISNEIFEVFVDKCLNADSSNSSAAFKKANLLISAGKSDEAKCFLLEFLDRTPSISILLELLRQNDTIGSEIDIVSLLERSISGENSFVCVKCGYQTSQIEWKCPSCQNWGCIKPGAVLSSAPVVDKIY